ncbi:tetratricopeptide repeat protein [Kosakonia sp.]|uniref:tetratricopeptide repeat protein n=1 Tax=Kosakonia sp. TaxID=1916651 RepID=UPI00289B9908|nr:tetratricopeptide repeat protein [Kosakonia sp.]
MRKYGYGALTLLFAAFGCQAEITEAQIAADCAKITDYAKQGNQYYQAKNYPKAREAFEQQAAWIEQCEYGKDQPNDVLMATAYNNVALTWIRQGEYRKAQAWLQIMPDDQKSQYNLSRIQDKLQALPKPTSAAGEYWQYAGRGEWEVLTLKADGNARYQADWAGYSFGIMGLYSGPNLGEFSEKVTLTNGKGDIKLHDDISQCTISLALSADMQTLEAQTDDPMNCGFGHNVSADGKYLRVQ